MKVCVLVSLLGFAPCTALCVHPMEEWHVAEGCRWRSVSVAGNGAAGFTLLSPDETGVAFRNELDLRQRSSNRVLDSGSGVALGDMDGDGLVDLFFCNLQGRNALYKNLGNWRFLDVTTAAGISSGGEFCRGAVFADLTGDRILDLLISTTGRGVLVFKNDGHGHFREMTKAAGTESTAGSMTLTIADIDGNGTLDLYVANYRSEDIHDRAQANVMIRDGKIVIPPWLQSRLALDEFGAITEYGEPDVLYLNDGRGRFSPVSWTDGAFLDEEGKRLQGAPLDWGLTATFRDVNADGAPDLYVCNDYWTPDRAWLNDGSGRFRAIPKVSLQHISHSSMGADFADLDRDGHVDFFVVDMLSRDHVRRNTQAPANTPATLPLGAIGNRPQIARNTLFRNRGDGTFAEIADHAGLRASEWSWQPIFVDVDLDGFEDVLISAGHLKDVQDTDTNNRIETLKRTGQLAPQGLSLQPTAPRTRQEHFTEELYQGLLLYPPLDAPIVAFRNRGDLRFEERTDAWGLNTPGVHHGMAMADLDGDGDLDLAVNNLNATAGIYRNNAAGPRVAVRLRGHSPNTQAIGAKVKVFGGAVPMQSQEVVCGGRYLSGSDPLVVFAGRAGKSMAIEVTWRNGKVSVVRGVQSNRLYEIEESVGTVAPSTRGDAAGALMFNDVSERLRHNHHENEFDDFAREPLLPNRLSRLGPGVLWHDVNADGRDDLVIGSGKGGSLTAFVTDSAGGFHPVASPALNGAVQRDQTGLVAWTEDGGNVCLLAGVASFEESEGESQAAQTYSFSNGLADLADALPDATSSTGPLAGGDLSGGGDMTVFVGGRVVPARYPAPAASRLFRKQHARWALDEANTARLKNLGLATGAVFSDLNGDGFPDLAVAVEWGPVTIFLNDGKGNLRDATERLGLAKFSGWWNGVSAGDFNEDGRMDLVATNWGLNHKDEHRYSPAHPLRIYYGDFNGNGGWQIIETGYDSLLGKVVPERNFTVMSSVMPWIEQIVPTHRAYGAAALEEIFGERLGKAGSASANTLAHTLFLNRGNRFEAAALPRDAQFAPAFGVTVADFNGDGHEDVFLAQNFFAVRPDTPRLDGGLGALLLGDGSGSFTVVPASVSGIAVFGDARGCAAADYDQDGRTDLVIAQNGAATKLYHNVGGRAGLRVRLNGPPGNRDGIGAQLRLQFGKRRGPVRELHAGSGYWSQDSMVPVLGMPATAAQLWVRWPGGKVTTTKVPAGAKEVVVAIDR